MSGPLPIRADHRIVAGAFYPEAPDWDWSRCNERNRRQRTAADTEVCPWCRGWPYVKFHGLSRLCPWCRGAGVVRPEVAAAVRPLAAQAMLEEDGDGTTAFAAINTAHGSGLDRLAQAYGATRRPGEDDERFRVRLRFYSSAARGGR